MNDSFVTLNMWFTTNILT